MVVMTRDSEASIAYSVLEAINDRDYSQIEKLCTESVQLRMPPAQVFFGRDGLREFFQSLERVIPDLTLTADQIHSGDDFVVIEYDAAGHPRGSADEAMGAIVLRLAEGKIGRIQLYVDTAHWERLQQAG